MSQLVLVVIGAFVILLIYFRSHFDWYREFRGGLWVEMEYSRGQWANLWRRKGFRYLGFWYGWSGWRSTGSTHTTREYKQRQRVAERWQVPRQPTELTARPQEPPAPPGRVPLHIVEDTDRQDRAA